MKNVQMRITYRLLSHRNHNEGRNAHAELVEDSVVVPSDLGRFSNCIDIPLFVIFSSPIRIPLRLSMIRLPMTLKLARRTGVSITARVCRVDGSVTSRTRFETPRAG